MILNVYKNGKLFHKYFVKDIAGLNSIKRIYPFLAEIIDSNLPFEEKIFKISKVISSIKGFEAVPESDSPQYHEDPWTEEKYRRGGDEEYENFIANRKKNLKKSILNKSLKGDLKSNEQVVDNISQQISKKGTKDSNMFREPEDLVSLYRAYKNSPHNPTSLLLKYMVHRYENHDQYEKANKKQTDALDQEFLDLHQLGNAHAKNGHVTINDLRQGVLRNKDAFKEIIDHKDTLHDFIKTFHKGDIKDIDGEPHIALTRGLNVDKHERSKEHSLSSYAHTAETGFGTHYHHQLVPLKNIWFSYDYGPQDASSEEFGPENELLVSPHEIKYNHNEGIDNLDILKTRYHDIDDDMRENIHKFNNLSPEEQKQTLSYYSTNHVSLLPEHEQENMLNQAFEELKRKRKTDPRTVHLKPILDPVQHVLKKNPEKLDKLLTIVHPGHAVRALSYPHTEEFEQKVFDFLRKNGDEDSIDNMANFSKHLKNENVIKELADHFINRKTDNKGMMISLLASNRGSLHNLTSKQNTLHKLTKDQVNKIANMFPNDQLHNVFKNGTEDQVNHVIKTVKTPKVFKIALGSAISSYNQNAISHFLEYADHEELPDIHMASMTNLNEENQHKLLNKLETHKDKMTAGVRENIIKGLSRTAYKSVGDRVLDHKDMTSRLAGHMIASNPYYHRPEFYHKAVERFGDDELVHRHALHAVSKGFKGSEKLANIMINKNANNPQRISEINESIPKPSQETKKPKKIKSKLAASMTHDTELVKHSIAKHINHLQKSVSDIAKNVRTKDRFFVSFDGDNIGASVERAAMSDDLQTIINQSTKIANGAEVIKKWAKQHDCDIYISGGDDIAMTMPKKHVLKLIDLKDMYHEKTGFTVTVGIGNTISQAGRAMLYGKLNGKDQVNMFTEEVAQYLLSVTKKLTPEEKLAEHGLLQKGIKKQYFKAKRILKRMINKKEETDIPHVASIAVINGNKLLMGKRLDNKKWTLPGGHFEPGEDPKTAALRELKEESNITPKYIFKLGSKKITCEDGKDRIIHVFCATGEYNPSSKHDPDEEVGNWKWIHTDNGIHEDIMNNLHSPKNVTLNLLGLQSE